MIHVQRIVARTPPHRQMHTSANLRQSRKARSDSPTPPHGIRRNQICNPGSGSHQCHVPPEDIKQLRRFVDSKSTQEATEGGDIGISIDTIARGSGTVSHGAKFQHLKGNAVSTHPLLNEQRRPRRLKSNESAEKQAHRQPNDQRWNCDQQVQHAFAPLNVPRLWLILHRSAYGSTLERRPSTHASLVVECDFAPAKPTE